MALIIEICLGVLFGLIAFVGLIALVGYCLNEYRWWEYGKFMQQVGRRMKTGE